MSLNLQCPTCTAPVTWDESFPDRPFCSPRCRLIDLGAWASEEHVVPGEELEQDLYSGDLPQQ